MENFASLSEPILSAEELTLSRGRRRVYQDLNISFGIGITAILGPNGAGKTTLIEGLLEPGRVREGRIRLDGLAVPDQVSLPLYLSQVGHMPQDWRYFAGFTVQESVEYVAWLKGVPSRRLTVAAKESLAQVDLTAYRKSKVRTLSGGMRQRVGLAEALVNNPRVVLLDEPTVGLDPAQRALFRNSIRDRANDRAIVISTHLTDDVDAVADRVIVIDSGQIKFDGTPSTLSGCADGQVRGASPLESGYLAVIDSPILIGRQ